MKSILSYQGDDLVCLVISHKKIHTTIGKHLEQARMIYLVVSI